MYFEISIVYRVIEFSLVYCYQYIVAVSLLISEKTEERK